MGDPEVGAGQIFQQVSRNLQRWEQTQTFHSDSPDRLSSSDFPGEILYIFIGVLYTAVSLRLKGVIL